MEAFDKNIDVSKMYSGVSEKQVLGCILKNPILMQEALSFITASKVFYRPPTHLGSYVLFTSIKQRY